MMYWTCIILFCTVYITFIHILSKGFRGACRRSFWGFSGRLPFVQLLNLASYFYFDRTCCVTFERDDFIEEACVFSCHPNFNTKPLSRIMTRSVHNYFKLIICNAILQLFGLVDSMTLHQVRSFKKKIDCVSAWTESILLIILFAILISLVLRFSNTHL